MKKFSDSTHKEKYKDIKEGLKNILDKNIPNKDELRKFINSYIENKKELYIEGLINSSDILEFYLKFKNDIDEILYDTKFYEKSPESLEVFGLNDYVIKGTKESILEILKFIKKDLK